ncbi:hypothetical protein HK098_005734 [Nowakowskiella sp. JEL0407]|nr:hypothetical protein HK098_005734 [Nowakowskiella sp. JEL0407]
MALSFHTRLMSHGWDLEILTFNVLHGSYSYLLSVAVKTLRSIPLLLSSCIDYLDRLLVFIEEIFERGLTLSIEMTVRACLILYTNTYSNSALLLILKLLRPLAVSQLWILSLYVNACILCCPTSEITLGCCWLYLALFNFAFKILEEAALLCAYLHSLFAVHPILQQFFANQDLQPPPTATEPPRLYITASQPQHPDVLTLNPNSVNSLQPAYPPSYSSPNPSSRLQFSRLYFSQLFYSQLTTSHIHNIFRNPFSSFLQSSPSQSQNVPCNLKSPIVPCAGGRSPNKKNLNAAGNSPIMSKIWLPQSTKSAQSTMFIKIERKRSKISWEEALFDDVADDSTKTSLDPVIFSDGEDDLLIDALCSGLDGSVVIGENSPAGVLEDDTRDALSDFGVGVDKVIDFVGDEEVDVSYSGFDAGRFIEHGMINCFVFYIGNLFLKSNSTVVANLFTGGEFSVESKTVRVEANGKAEIRVTFQALKEAAHREKLLIWSGVNIAKVNLKGSVMRD